MIQISEAAQTHFRKLIEREAIPGLGVRLAARDAGTPRADVRLEFAETGELSGDEWAVDCEGFTLWPVSYTHLDVYKRQGHGWPESIPLSPPLSRIFLTSHCGVSR